MAGRSKIYKDLGIKPVINAHGHPTAIGGNNPSKVVKAAMEDASLDYVKMSELVKVSGERIAEMLNVPFAMVTPGCSAALSLGAAACITRNNEEAIEQLPDVTGLPNEFIIQKQLRVSYDKAVTVPGGVLIEVGNEDRTTEKDIEESINENTAGIHYLAGGLYDDPDEREQRTDIVAFNKLTKLAQRNNIPLLVDAAGQVYPTNRLSLYAQNGADLVGYGGKYFEGLNTSGLLVGANEHLIRLAYRLSFVGFEYEHTRVFGRSIKMDRQTVIGTFVALQEWLKMDHESRLAQYENRLNKIRYEIANLPGVTVADFPDKGMVEGLRIMIDKNASRLSADELQESLKNGDPIIHLRTDTVANSLIIRIQTVDDGDEHLILKRLQEELG
ncbi:MAG: L-seryl-tRNA(Ser) seleniumtransferase [Chloroflexi bacterium]|jgi:L-seryl-tRNA(Ser) seleniumtransferase|nr:MAG: L-seryl-tRNA(Ser) seleniumtransferase [Chloroflexota bacterium]